jgi:hypothetical protein
MDFKISPYKHPVENQAMNKSVDKFITGFFVVVLGIIWYFSTKFHVNQNQFNIIVYDTLGKEFHMNGIRTNFKTKNVAISYIKEYKSRFPNYDFTIAEEIPQFKDRIFSNKIKI